MMYGALRGFRNDPEELAGKHLEWALLRRVFRLARPYRWLLAGFLLTAVAASITTVIPPLLFRSLLDTAVPDKNRALVAWLAAGAVVLAIANALLSLWQRWYSARIGEGLIFDHAREAVRPHPADAGLVLHPHPDGRPHVPHEQRRDRCPAGHHQHPRHGRRERHHARGDPHRDARARVAADDPHPDRAARVHPPGPPHRTAAPAHHPRGHATERVDEQHDRRALQRRRRARRQAVREARPRARPVRGPRRACPRHRRHHRHVLTSAVRRARARRRRRHGRRLSRRWQPRDLRHALDRDASPPS